MQSPGNLIRQRKVRRDHPMRTSARLGGIALNRRRLDPAKVLCTPLLFVFTKSRGRGHRKSSLSSKLDAAFALRTAHRGQRDRLDRRFLGSTQTFVRIPRTSLADRLRESHHVPGVRLMRPPLQSQRHRFSAKPTNRIVQHACLPLGSIIKAHHQRQVPRNAVCKAGADLSYHRRIAQLALNFGQVFSRICHGKLHAMARTSV